MIRVLIKGIIKVPYIFCYITRSSKFSNNQRSAEKTHLSYFSQMLFALLLYGDFQFFLHFYEMDNYIKFIGSQKVTVNLINISRRIDATVLTFSNARN